ncbi:MAG: hypothetical protein J6J10_00905 [Alistipes sp.]|nr:hypothetical protein [Alistipes sp.]
MAEGIAEGIAEGMAEWMVKGMAERMVKGMAAREMKIYRKTLNFLAKKIAGIEIISTFVIEKR